VAEIGINHNGDLGVAKALIDVAIQSGANAVKFQKRTPELCVPDDQKGTLRETPWGTMTYLEYRHRVEFGEAEYREIDRYCREQGILWFASCWDEPSVAFMERLAPPCHKIASASLTDSRLLRAVAKTGRTVILSTGMSTLDEIERAAAEFDLDHLIICHSTSAYPCPPHQLNLRMIPALARRFDCPIGYSGHETGIQTTGAAVALGAKLIERHITLDRMMWGTDQAASLEPEGFRTLIRDIRIVEQALGDGEKQVYESELPIKAKLRRAASASKAP
jgi:N-acetylneuraminate synthase